jgi:hypothetical protein
MAKFGELSKEAKPEVDIATVPEQFAGRDPLPQPGKGYVLALPFIDLNTHDVDDIPSAEGPTKSRFAVTFGGRSEGGKAYPDGIRVVKSPDGESDGTNFRWRCSNEERKFADDQGSASAMYYLLMYGFGEIADGMSNYEYAEALARHSGEEFKADIVWTSSCSKKKDIYKMDWASGEGKTIEGVKGCDTAYATYRSKKKVLPPKETELAEDGETEVQTNRFASRFDCQCGALISMFPELRNFQPVDEKREEVEEKIKAAKEAAVNKQNTAAAAPKQAAPQRTAPAKPSPAPAATRAAAPAKR